MTRNHLFLALLLVTFVSCNLSDKAVSENLQGPVPQPEWSRNDVIYELNIRQFTKEGTFRSATSKLQELKDLGVDILWLMPIHPIGELNRKGSLGSYYSIRDYTGINPEFGTAEEFKDFVRQAQRLGMKVIIDWVANHTSWDHAWTQSHPEWYTKNEKGEFMPPVADWSDVIDLNYDQPALREAMIEAMEFWVKNYNIDGFRCDVAEMVPQDFWEAARVRLDAIKPVFMLAEAENPKLHEKAFNMAYGWQMHHTLNNIAKGGSLTTLDSLVEVYRTAFPKDAYIMHFTSNHDENSWNGTEFERMGEGAKAFAVLTATLEGMPLIYNGQEVGMNKRLKFFDKDSIPWRENEYRRFYQALNLLKEEQSSLWNGTMGAPLIKLAGKVSDRVYAFHRTNEDHSVIVILNFSTDSTTVSLNTEALPYRYKDVFLGSTLTMSPNLNVALGPWDYKIYTKHE